jgi:hypothetical protein
MDDGSAIRLWLNRSRPFFASLSEAVGLNGQEHASAPATVENAEKISRSLRSLQEWLTDNPLPDSELNDRVQLLAARFGYAVLVGASDWDALNRATQVPLEEHLKELNHELVRLLSDIEQLETGRDAIAPNG